VDLAPAVAPLTLARERTLPVAAPLAPLLPDGALVRGRVLSCAGPAAASLALGLAVEAASAGAWLAVVDVPWLGVEAAAELGVPLERLVRVEPGERAGTGGAWADLMAAVLDGFELIVTRVPRRLGAGVLRRVQTRVQHRGAVVVLIGSPGAWSPDITMQASAPVWEGVEQGAGHLRGRRVTVEASGRRVPRPRRAELWLPAPGGAIAAADGVTALRPVG
jgi:hypothetical protein